MFAFACVMELEGYLFFHIKASEKLFHGFCRQVRRAAAMVLTMLLEGLGRDAFAVLESSLREILR